MRGHATVERDTWLARARESVPKGSSSGNRVPWNEVIVRAAGAYVWNADGLQFVDYLLAWGPIVLGHCDPRVNEAAMRAATECDLTAIGPQHGEVELAEAICEVMPSAERVAFCTSGSEATLHAVQLARAATNRTKLVKFHGSYHGWHDALAVGSRFVSGPVADLPLNEPDAGGLHSGSLSDAIVIEWNDLSGVEEAFADQGRDLAAVVCEAYVHSYGCVPAADGFLETLRTLCTKHDTVLIFDEVKTGFRADLGGYQAVCGVTPDLTAFAKAIANGYPLAGVAGRADLMDAVGGEAEASFAGTYNAWPPAIAAALATLEILREGALERISFLGEQLREGLSRLIAASGIPACVAGFGSEWVVYFRAAPPMCYREALDSDTRLARRFQQAMMAGRILEPIFPIADRRLCAATSDEDIARTLEVAERALSQLD